MDRALGYEPRFCRGSTPLSCTKNLRARAESVFTISTLLLFHFIITASAANLLQEARRKYNGRYEYYSSQGS